VNCGYQREAASGFAAGKTTGGLAFMVLDLMRRYVHGWVNCHDPAVAREIVAAGYRVRMGPDVVEGRDEAFIPAVMHQVKQFPGLTFSVHELITDGTSAGVLFSEHGRSAEQPDRVASWRGVGIWRSCEGLLARCWVEQDYYGRRYQLATGQADPVARVATDPWTGHLPVTDADRAAATAAVTSWAAGLARWPDGAARVDTGGGRGARPALAVAGVAVNAVVAEGTRVAFHVSIRGRYEGGLPGPAATGTPVEAHVAGFATVRDGTLADVDAISNRVALQRQLRATSTGSMA
jgi:predicted ester cyclase